VNGVLTLGKLAILNLFKNNPDFLKINLRLLVTLGYFTMAFNFHLLGTFFEIFSLKGGSKPTTNFSYILPSF